MITILLLSPSNNIFAEISTALLEGCELILLNSAFELQEYLQSRNSAKSDPLLVLVDTMNQPKWEETCQSIHRMDGGDNIPILAIIADLLKRAVVFEAGADDYLIYPIVDSAFQARIRHYTRFQEIFTQFEEMQYYGAQTASVVLLARLIGERLELDEILSESLSQTVAMLNADGGEIWLLDEDGQYLEAASSLTASALSLKSSHQLSGQGVLGLVMMRNQSVQLAVPTDETRFDLQVNVPEEGCSLLAVPLSYQGQAIGVITMYCGQTEPFSPQEVSLLETSTTHIAAAISHAQLVRELRNYAEQQQVLYEMSRQISGGLDLDTTIERALQWTGRLINVEIGLLWLFDDKNDIQKRLYLAAAIGVDTGKSLEYYLNLESCPEGQAIHNKQAVVINDLNQNPYCQTELSDLLAFKPRNLLVLPMLYHDQTIGAITLFNKLGGPFNPGEVKLLSMAIEMTAIAVNNARLYTQTLALMKEHDLLHRKAVQNERLKTIGRLTASLAHAINNPLQAIRGALILAQEDIDHPEDLAAYISLCQQESKRLVNIIGRLRSMYRPRMDKVESIDINRLLEEALAVTQEEMKRQDVVLIVDLAPGLPPISAIFSQLHLAFLGILLNFTDGIGALGGGQLQVRTGREDGQIYAVFHTDDPISLDTDIFAEVEDLEQQDFQEIMDIVFGLAPTRDIIIANGGELEFIKKEQGVTLRILLPESK